MPCRDECVSRREKWGDFQSLVKAPKSRVLNIRQVCLLPGLHGGACFTGLWEKKKKLAPPTVPQVVVQATVHVSGADVARSGSFQANYQTLHPFAGQAHEPDGHHPSDEGGWWFQELRARLPQPPPPQRRRGRVPREPEREQAFLPASEPEPVQARFHTPQPATLSCR